MAIFRVFRPVNDINEVLRLWMQVNYLDFQFKPTFLHTYLSMYPTYLSTEHTYVYLSGIFIVPYTYQTS